MKMCERAAASRNRRTIRRRRAWTLHRRRDRLRVLALAFTPRFIVLTLSILVTVALAARDRRVDGAAVEHGAPRRRRLVRRVFRCSACATSRRPRHAVLRNYPISAHLRFLLEEMRPEMRQYFFESETDGLPFSRNQRADRLSARQDGSSTSGRSARSSTSTLRATSGCAIRSRRSEVAERTVPGHWSAGPIARSPIRRRCSIFRR